MFAAFLIRDAMAYSVFFLLVLVLAFAVVFGLVADLPQYPRRVFTQAGRPQFERA